MSKDVVNAFFRKHYPADHATNWEMRPCGANGYGREYLTRNGSYIFPLMRCADGFSMSVQGHFGAYSTPRDDFADFYSHVEVWNLSEPEPLFDAWESGRRDRMGLEPLKHAGIDSPMGYVPVSVVVAVIEKHGGLVEAAND